MERKFDVKAYATSKAQIEKMTFYQNDTGASGILFEVNQDPQSAMDGIVSSSVTLQNPSESDNKTFGMEYITIDGNVIDFTLPNWALSEEGTYNGQIMVYGSDSKRLTMTNFKYKVNSQIPNGVNNDDSDIPILTELINSTNEVMNRHEDNYEEALALSSTNANLEIVDARKGEANLGVKIGLIDSSLEDMATQTDFLQQQYKASDNNVISMINQVTQYINDNLVLEKTIVTSDLINTGVTSSVDGSNNVVATKSNSESFTWLQFNTAQKDASIDIELTGRTYIVLGANESKCITVSMGISLDDFGQISRWKLGGVQEQILAKFADTTNKGAIGDTVRIERKDTYYKLSIKRNGQSTFVDWFNVNFTQPNAINITTEFAESELKYGVMKFTVTASEIMCKNVKYKNFVVLKAPSKWSGKVWNAIGDSITWLDKYMPVVKNSLALSSYRNYGKSGFSTVMLKGDLDSWDVNADIVTFFAGTNDFGRCDTLATTQSSVDYIFSNLKVKYPNKTIAVFLPLQRWGYTGDTVKGSQPTMTNSDGITLRQYCDVIKSKAEQYGIPVLDLYYLSGIDKNNISTYTTDGLHPNNEGFSKIAQVMIDFINTL